MSFWQGEWGGEGLVSRDERLPEHEIWMSDFYIENVAQGDG